jgi:hypothetical protein
MRPFVTYFTGFRRLLSGPARAACRLWIRLLWPMVELCGAALICVCVGLYEPRLAVGLAGLMLLVAANFRTRRTP